MDGNGIGEEESDQNFEGEVKRHVFPVVEQTPLSYLRTVSIDNKMSTQE